MRVSKPQNLTRERTREPDQSHDKLIIGPARDQAFTLVLEVAGAEQAVLRRTTIQGNHQQAPQPSAN